MENARKGNIRPHNCDVCAYSSRAKPRLAKHKEGHYDVTPTGQSVSQSIDESVAETVRVSVCKSVFKKIHEVSQLLSLELMFNQISATG